MPGRWLHAVCDYWDLELGVAYGPPQAAIRKGVRMPAFWNWLPQASSRLVDRRSVICGDLDTGELDSTNHLARALMLV